MSVIPYDDFGVLVLDHLRELAEHGRLSDASHVLEAYLGRAGFDELVGYAGVVFGGVYGRVGDAERGLRGHAAFEGIFDGGNDVTHIVQSAEYACDVHTLCVFHAVHEFAHVGGYGEHAQGVEAAVEHVCLYAGFVEGLGKGAHGLVRVFAVEQVHLFEGAAVGFYAGKASHLDDDGCDALQLVFAGLELAAALEHVTIDKTELYFTFCHTGGYD